MRGEATCAVTIPVPPKVAYGFWSDVASYPRWLEHLDRVDVFDDRHSRWFMVLPGGTPLTWETEITMHRPDEQWAWSSASGGLVSYGSVQMRALAEDRTRMQVRRFHGAPRHGRDGIAPWAEDPKASLRRDLERLVGYIRSHVSRRDPARFSLQVGTSRRSPGRSRRLSP